MSYYGQGDYYLGDYYRGDLLGFFKKAVGAVAKTVGGVLPGPLGTVARTVGGALTGKGKATAPVQFRSIPAPVPYSYPEGRLGPMIIPTPGLKGKVQRALPGGATGYEAVPPGYTVNARGEVVRRRRMNVANVHALRRAIRRAKGFEKLARRVGSFTAPGKTYRLKGRGRKRS